MKLAIFSLTLGAASAFAPSTSHASITSLSMSDAGMTDDDVKADKLPGAPLNGWVPDKKLPCYGLPGAIAPLGFFDPLGFTKDLDLSEVKRFREAEVMHGRVAMMAALGYVIGESTPTIAYGMDTHHTIANNQLAEVAGTGIYFWTVVFPSTLRYIVGQSTPNIGVSPTTTAYGMDVQQTIANNQLPEITGTGNVFWFAIFPLFLAINFAESWRANTGWVKPGGVEPPFTLSESYYPGDIGFDPFGLKSTDAKEFAFIQSKELSNGRLAMLAVAGFCAQELVNGKGILENLGF